jgi:cytochrome c-type biogenesis protein CcmH
MILRKASQIQGHVAGSRRERSLPSFHFWSLALFMVLAATAILVVPLYWRESRLPSGSAWLRWEPLVVVTAVPSLALALYYFLGSPALADATSAPATRIADAHANAMRAGNRDGGDLDQAIAKLRARLEANPDDAAGWNLLAQSYEFQGDSAAAADARARASAPGGATLPASSGSAAAPGSDADSAELAQRAQQARRARDFTAAVATFAELERRGALDADLWADYADALGGARGRLDDDAARCIAAALRLDPRHVKALWLRASLQTQQRDHRAALATWQQIDKLLPAGSPDARIIAANIAEARADLDAAGGVVATADADSRMLAAPAGPVLKGDVRLDPRWQSRVGTGSVLFVYARAADERGPPLAVWRTSTGTWPVRFALGDADAMVPGRRLSNYRRVVLEARVSRSGNATPQPGDLRGVSAVLDPNTAPEQQLVIAEEVGARAQGS